jgi:hypothetical protein
MFDLRYEGMWGVSFTMPQGGSPARCHGSLGFFYFIHRHFKPARVPLTHDHLHAPRLLRSPYLHHAADQEHEKPVPGQHAHKRERDQREADRSALSPRLDQALLPSSEYRVYQCSLTAAARRGSSQVGAEKSTHGRKARRIIFAARPPHESDSIDFCPVDDRVFSIAAWMASRFLAARWYVEFLSTRGYNQGRPGNHLQYG